MRRAVRASLAVFFLLCLAVPLAAAEVVQSILSLKK